jgi:hypothetical protein
MKNTIIDKIYYDYSILLNYLETNEEISLRNDADNNFKKVLLLSTASFFEHKITEILLDFINESSNNNFLIYSFAKKKAVDRQYHTYFDWKNKSANPFFALFGVDFKKDIEKEMKINEALKKSVRDFMEIGYIRNELVHENFANFSLDKTANEIYDLYESATIFIDYLMRKFSHKYAVSDTSSEVSSVDIDSWLLSVPSPNGLTFADFLDSYKYIA